MLTLEIEPNGTIHKICSGPEGFCAMAETAGYHVEQQATAIDIIQEGPYY